MLGIHPSLSEAQLLSFIKAGFLLYSNYHLHDNLPLVYEALTQPHSTPSHSFLYPSVVPIILPEFLMSDKN